MKILAHRGIDFDKEIIPENSLRSFLRAAEADCGFELDILMGLEGKLAVAHDPIDTDSVCFLKDALRLAENFNEILIAIHLKGPRQTQDVVEELIGELKNVKNMHERVLVFDLKLETAEIFRGELPKIGLAPSVADPADISRFQSRAGGTLYTPDQVLNLRKIFNWVWLDEWDRKGLGSETKNLYRDDLVSKFRSAGFRVAMISPELHKAEKHGDGKNVNSVEKRWIEMIKSRPDAICTDYPSRLKTLFKVQKND